jgi:hypothetical protein
MSTLILPDPIAAYFAADPNSTDAITRCFTTHAVVKDEGRTYTGLEAIKAWQAVADCLASALVRAGFVLRDIRVLFEHVAARRFVRRSAVRLWRGGGRLRKGGS